MSHFLFLLGLGVSYGIFRFILSILETRRQQKFADKNGCKPPHHFDGGIFGIRRFLEIMAHSKNGTVVQFVCSRFEEKRTWSASLLNLTFISTIEPENLKAILATQFEDFSLAYRKQSFNPLLGDGIFNTDGKIWEHSRALLRPQFARSQVSDLNALEHHVQALFKHLPTNGDEVEIQDLFFRLTVDSATEFLFGKCTDTLVDANSSSLTYGGYNFAQAFTIAQEWAIMRLRLTFLNPLVWLRPDYHKVHTAVHKIMDELITQTLAERDLSDSKRAEEYVPKNGKYVFLEALAHEVDDPKVIKDQLLNILLAGRDTTATLLTWTFFSLSRNPHLYAKLRSAVISAFGTSDTSRITFTSLKDCTYLRYTLNEALRLFPSVPINSRVAVRDTILPTGGGPDQRSPMFIKKNQPVNYHVYALHRRKDVWGDNAEEFLPDRWDPAHPSHRKIGGWDYLPFNGGPRICLGQQYALTEAGYVVARICQRFEKISMDDLEPPILASSLTMPSGRPVMLRMWGDEKVV